MERIQRVVAVMVTLVVCFCSPSLAQNAGSGTTIIDGKSHPDQISDAIAYLHFFRALCRTNETDSIFAQRRLSIVNQIGLSSTQTDAVFKEADNFSTKIIEFDSLPLASQRTASNIAARSAMVLSLVAHLQGVLGRQGTLLLTQYIDSVIKPETTVYILPQ